MKSHSVLFSAICSVLSCTIVIAEVDLSLSARVSVPQLQDELIVGRDSVRGVFRNSGTEPVWIVMPTTATGREAFSLEFEYADRTVTAPAWCHPIKTGGMGVVEVFQLGPGEVYIFEIEVNSTKWIFPKLSEATAKVRVKYAISSSEKEYFSSPAMKFGSGFTIPEMEATSLNLTSSAIALTIRPDQLENKQGEQGGADQPATASESKSEGDEKTKPESEGRSQ